MGSAATAEQLLLAARDKALGRCLGKGAKGRARRPVRMVSGALFTALQLPGAIAALVRRGAELGALADAADTHIAAELVRRWPAEGRDDEVCRRVWARLVRVHNGWAATT